MNELIESMNKCLANTFVMYFKAHSYHWNVEGIHFSQYHEFFSEIYTDLHGAVDVIAEHIRIEGPYAPMSLTELYNYNGVTEDASVPETCQAMVSNLYDANNIVVSCLNETFKLANDTNKQGLADFIAGRIDIHKKHEWMLRVSMKGM